MSKKKIANTFWIDDVLEFLIRRETDTADMTFFSPPYETARHYQSEGTPYEHVTVISGDDWVDWMTTVIMEAVRVTSGPVFCVVNSRTKDFKWSPTPCKLVAMLDENGVCQRKMPIYHKPSGIPGSGGPDWLRDDYEFIIVCTSGGKLPWSDSTACGHPPKYKRMNVPSGGRKNGDSLRSGNFVNKALPKLCNPGNVVLCNVGKGHMGNDLAHENEAPFPETLVEFFIRSFCPPGGIVMDPFGGSGTVAAVARRLERDFLYNDSRESQARLAIRRVYDISVELAAAIPICSNEESRNGS